MAGDEGRGYVSKTVRVTSMTSVRQVSSVAVDGHGPWDSEAGLGLRNTFDSET